MFIVYPPSRTVSLKLRTLFKFLEEAIAGTEQVFERQPEEPARALKA